MVARAPSLPLRVDPAAALAAVGIDPAAAPRSGSLARTARYTCPRCQESAFFDYHDRITGGRWYHCRRCDLSGDPIEVVASVHGTSIIDSVRSLVKDASEAETDDYVAGYTARRREAARLLVDLRHLRPASDGPSARLCRALGIRYDPVGAAWEDGLGRHVGFLPLYEAFERLYALGGGRPRRQPSWYEGMVGLVVPFHDIPGRVCGAAVLHLPSPREAARHPAARGYDLTYLPVRYPGRGPLSTGTADPGVGLFPAAWSYGCQREALVVTTDILSAVRLQARQALASHRLLALAVTVAGPSAVFAPPPPFAARTTRYRPYASLYHLRQADNRWETRGRRRLVLACDVVTIASDLMPALVAHRAQWVSPHFDHRLTPILATRHLDGIAYDPLVIDPPGYRPSPRR